MTPRVPWTPIDVMQILLAWILAFFISQIAFGLFLPPHIEGTHEVIETRKIRINGTNVVGRTNVVVNYTFLPGKHFRTPTTSGTYDFQGNPPLENRFVLELVTDQNKTMIVSFQGTPRDRVGMVLVTMIFIQCGAIALVLLLLRKYGLRWREAFGGLSPPALTVALPFLLGSLIILPAMVLHIISSDLIIYFDGVPTAQQAVQMVSRAENVAEISIQILSVIIFAPIAEELLFRGALYPSLKNAGHPRFAVITSALLFAAVHAKWELMLPFFMLGLGLVWVYEKTRSILAPIVMHATFNAVNFAMIKFVPPEQMKNLQDTIRNIIHFWN